MRAVNALGVTLFTVMTVRMASSVKRLNTRVRDVLCFRVPSKGQMKLQSFKPTTTELSFSSPLATPQVLQVLTRDFALVKVARQYSPAGLDVDSRPGLPGLL